MPVLLPGSKTQVPTCWVWPQKTLLIDVQHHRKKWRFCFLSFLGCTSNSAQWLLPVLCSALLSVLFGVWVLLLESLKDHLVAGVDSGLCASRASVPTFWLIISLALRVWWAPQLHVKAPQHREEEGNKSYNKRVSTIWSNKPLHHLSRKYCLLTLTF